LNNDLNTSKAKNDSIKNAKKSNKIGITEENDYFTNGISRNEEDQVNANLELNENDDE